MTEHACDEIVLRALERGDVHAAARLMEASGQVISGMRTARAYRTLCSEAVLDPRVVVVVGDCRGRLVGYGVGFIDWRRYRRSYGLRHPLLAVSMLAERALASIGLGRRSDSRRLTRLPAPPGVRPAGASGRSWRDSSPEIAKIAEIFVAAECRGQGLGSKLVLALYRELAARGARRVDCRTDIRNAASLRMNDKVGLLMEMTGRNALFGTRDLPASSEDTSDDQL